MPLPEGADADCLDLPNLSEGAGRSHPSLRTGSFEGVLRNELLDDAD